MAAAPSDTRDHVVAERLFCPTILRFDECEQRKIACLMTLCAQKTKSGRVSFLIDVCYPGNEEGKQSFCLIVVRPLGEELDWQLAFGHGQDVDPDSADNLQLLTQCNAWPGCHRSYDAVKSALTTIIESTCGASKPELHERIMNPMLDVMRTWENPDCIEHCSPRPASPPPPPPAPERAAPGPLRHAPRRRSERNAARGVTASQ